MKRITLMLFALLIAVPVFALDYDQNVTPDVIFGSGNANGGFTVDTQNNIELGLRAKLRFDGSGLPQDIYNSNGDGTYSFNLGAAVGGAGWVAATTPVWNFEWTVNVSVDGSGQTTLDDFTYELGIDDDPGSDETNFLIWDQITPTVSIPVWDHAIGDNSTTQATKLVTNDGPTYVGYLANYYVAQNSWNYEFFNEAPWDGFDPSVPGVYNIYLKAFNGAGAMVAHTEIKVLVGGAVGTEAASWGGVKSLFR